MLKRYMHKRERHFAMLNDNRVVRPFEWGTEFIGHERDAADPHEIFKDFSAETIANSDEYFSIPKSFDFTLGNLPHVRTGSGSDRVSPGCRGTSRGNPVATARGSDREPTCYRSSRY